MFSPRPRTLPGILALLLGPASALCASSLANAELVPVDHPHPTIAKITLDTETGLEWLDVTESTGLSYAGVEVGALLMAAALGRLRPRT